MLRFNARPKFWNKPQINLQGGEMNLLLKMVTIAIIVGVLSGCETTNSIPYKASTNNIVAIQQTVKPSGGKVNVGGIEMASGAEESLTCRLMGPIKVAPGKTLPEYIKDAFVEELFAAQAYDPKASTVISGTITHMSFKSVAPASWKIDMAVKSTVSAGYTVAIEYSFNTSFSAYSACKNVADAFGPAVQELLRLVVTDPGFAALVAP
jgi:hypothetical protein